MDTRELGEHRQEFSAGASPSGVDAAWLPTAERRRDAERRHRVDRRHRIAWEGLGVGALGATAALCWLLVAGAWRGRFLETPLDLGAYLIAAAGGVGSATSDQIATLFVTLLYAAFALVGVLGAVLVHGVRRGALVVALVGMSVAAEGLVVLLIVTAGPGAVDHGAWTNVAVGGLLAVLAMGWLLRRTHLRARRRASTRPRVRRAGERRAEHDTTGPPPRRRPGGRTRR